MKIQINSLEAVERLIGGDTEMEIEVRNSVVQEFAKKHLKAVAETQLGPMKDAVQNFIRDEFLNKEITKRPGWGETVTWSLKRDVLEGLKSTLQDEVKSILDDTLREAIDLEGTRKKIEQILERKVEYITSEIQQKLSEEHIERLVQKRLKERLGLQ